jgi:hypothetical protein
LVGNPRKPIHCVLKGQLEFEQSNGRSPDISVPNEVEFVRSIANNLLAEHFPSQKVYTADDIIRILDAHEPTVITINAVLASLQSQEAVKVLHHVLGSDQQKLGTLNTSYTIYNGLTGKFFEIPKSRNPSCQLCGPDGVQLVKIRASKDTPLTQVIVKVCELKRVKWAPDFPPSVYKIDTLKGLVEFDPVKTIGENNLRDYETMLLSGLEDDKSYYVMIRLS